MKSGICAVIAACAFAAWSQDASAKTVTFTYVGTITAGEDVTGVFGAPFSNLAGDRIKAVFTFDDSVGHRATNPGVSDGVVGGSSTSYATPSLGVTLTINGVKFSIGGDFYGSAINLGGKANASASYEDGNNFALAAVASSNTPASLDTPFQPRGGGGGLFQIDTFNTLGQPENAFANFALPEPSTWLLLLLGVGALGAALRRRTATSQAAVA